MVFAPAVLVALERWAPWVLPSAPLVAGQNRDFKAFSRGAIVWIALAATILIAISQNAGGVA